MEQMMTTLSGAVAHDFEFEFLPADEDSSINISEMRRGKPTAADIVKFGG